MNVCAEKKDPLRRLYGACFKEIEVETWYLTYAMLWAAVGGILPIIIPLLALKRFGGALQVGFVMAAYNLGGSQRAFGEASPTVTVSIVICRSLPFLSLLPFWPYSAIQPIKLAG